MSRITAGERIAGKRKAKKRQKITHSVLMRTLSTWLPTLKINMSVWLTQARQVWQRLPLRHRTGLGVASAAVFILLLLPSGEQAAGPGSDTPVTSSDDATKQPVPINMQNLSASVQGPRGPVPTPTDKADQAKTNSPPKSDQTKTATHDPELSYRVKNGDTLSNIFRQHALSLPDLYAMIKVEGDGQSLSQIQPGQQLSLRHDHEGRVFRMQVTQSTADSVTFVRQPDGSFRRR